MFAKWYVVNGIKCQGKVEKAVAELLFEKEILFSRGKAIKTPYGNYTPDFETQEYFIEVKGLHSWHMALGLKGHFEKADNPIFVEKSDLSLKKMLFVHNIKPIIVYIQIENCDKKNLGVIEPEVPFKCIRGDIQDLNNFLKFK